MTSRWLCYVEGFSSERCLGLHWQRVRLRDQDHPLVREHPYPIGHESCGWVELPEKADKRELAA